MLVPSGEPWHDALVGASVASPASPSPLWDAGKRRHLLEEVASHSCHGLAKLLQERHVVSEH